MGLIDTKVGNFVNFKACLLLVQILISRNLVLSVNVAP